MSLVVVIWPMGTRSGRLDPCLQYQTEIIFPFSLTPRQGQTYSFMHASLSGLSPPTFAVCRRNHAFVSLFPRSFPCLSGCIINKCHCLLWCGKYLSVHNYTVVYLLPWTRPRTFPYRPRRRVSRRYGPIVPQRRQDAMASCSSLVRVTIPGTHWYVPETTRLILSRLVSHLIHVYRIGR